MSNEMPADGKAKDAWTSFLDHASDCTAAADEPVDLPSIDAEGNVVWHRYFGLRFVSFETRNARNSGE